jgi:hypothetical protein
VATILAAIGWLERWRVAVSHARPVGPVARAGRAPIAAYSLACLVAALATLLPLGRMASPVATRFPGWPETLDGSPLVRVADRPEDERFTRGFPGRFARFTDGRRAVLLRWLPRPTRQLHPAADCLRGAGYRTSPRPARVDGRGTRWGCVEALRAGRSLVACEHIVDQAGRSWTDASSWWWAAALGRAAGPYWAITVVETSS